MLWRKGWFAWTVGLRRWGFGSGIQLWILGFLSFLFSVYVCLRRNRNAKASVGSKKTSWFAPFLALLKG